MPAERKMVRKNEIIVLNYLNGKNYITNYEPIKKEVDKKLKTNRKIYLNFGDVLFSKIFLNQIISHFKENSQFIKNIVILNSIPISIILDKIKDENNV